MLLHILLMQIAALVFNNFSLRFLKLWMFYINKIQQAATVCRYLFTAKSLSTCFGCPSRPLSGEHKTVTAAFGAGHSM